MRENTLVKELTGEALGTFIIVFIGCGTVALEILFESFGHIIPIAILWGIAVALAIFSSRMMSPAHLNPAVTVAMFLNKDVPLYKVPLYWLAQFTGAFLGAVALFQVFKSAIFDFEDIQSVNTAKMFGEYYNVSTSFAFIFEMMGALFLVFMIFIIVTKVKQNNLIPILIGAVVTVAIIIVAPYTQCGINPARDLAPRIFSYFSGWEEVAFSQSPILVYVIAPVLGGILGFLSFKGWRRLVSKQNHK